MTTSIGEITERREYLCRIVAVTALLGKQGLPLRGHQEGEESLNQGNFLETMKLLKQYDPFLQTYTAPSIIIDAIEKVLVSNGLDGLTCVAQAYDGASVMSGAKGGV